VLLGQARADDVGGCPGEGPVASQAETKDEGPDEGSKREFGGFGEVDDDGGEGDGVGDVTGRVRMKILLLLLPLLLPLFSLFPLPSSFLVSLSRGELSFRCPLFSLLFPSFSLHTH
jgi:hypothetical protein